MGWRLLTKVEMQETDPGIGNYAWAGIQCLCGAGEVEVLDFTPIDPDVLEVDDTCRHCRRRYRLRVEVFEPGTVQNGHSGGTWEKRPCWGRPKRTSL